MHIKEIFIHTEYIKLDSFLKLAGIASTGSDAKLMIADQLVLVNEEICTMRGKKLRDGDNVRIKNGEIYTIKNN